MQAAQDRTKELRRSETKTNGVRSWRQRELPAKVNKARATTDVTTLRLHRLRARQSFLGADYEGYRNEAIPGYYQYLRDEDESRTYVHSAHDPNYVRAYISRVNIPLEDDTVFRRRNSRYHLLTHPLLSHLDTLLSRIPRRIQRGTRMMRQRMVRLTILWTGRKMGNDGDDDDDGDSSGDDARDGDEDEEDEDDEEEEEHLAPADSTTVIPADEPVSPPEGTEPIVPPPSTDITIGARITIRPQTSISLPPEAEVERLLAMTTPSPSPPISLSPPSAGEHLARCMAPSAHSPPLPPSSGCLTQTQTLRIASTQALIDAVTAALPPPPLPPLPPSLPIPSPVDRRDDIPESEQPPRKSFAERPREGLPQDLYALIEMPREGDSKDGGGGGLMLPASAGSFDRIRARRLIRLQLIVIMWNNGKTLRVISRHEARVMTTMQLSSISAARAARTAGQSGTRG
ncbi:hypothetical protein Tco_0412366 [Tanacetum coccineum]